MEVKGLLLKKYAEIHSLTVSSMMGSLSDFRRAEEEVSGEGT